jgi:hypothetical protein
MNAFLVFAVLTAAAGLLSLSNATKGVGLICFSIFLVALVRIIQADAHQKALQENQPLVSSERPSAWVTVLAVLTAIGGVGIVLLAL